MSAASYERLLRCYPPRWRARYGDEMTALLEDTHAGGRPPVRVCIGLARTGLAERVREAGLAGPTPDPARRLRSASLVVLCGWSAFVLGGCLFAKFSDNWVAGTPPADRWVPSAAYDVVAVSGVIGCAAVLGAALAVGPAFWRLMAGGGWASVRRRFAWAAASLAGAVVLAAATVAWAHRLNAPQRNGMIPGYSALAAVTALAGVIALLCATVAAVAVGRRIALSTRASRRLGVLALGLTGLMVGVLAGIVAWWVAEAVHAPWVLGRGIGGHAFSSPAAPPVLLVAGLNMVVGLALATWGASRLVSPLRSHPS